MAKFLLIVCLILTITFIDASPKKSPAKAFQNITTSLVTSHELKELLKQNPNLVKLNRKVVSQHLNDQETKDSTAVAPKVILNYWLGSRTFRDWVVAKDENSYTWNELYDVQLYLRYPEEGTEHVVTFVDIYVSQSNWLGTAYVTSGGIGQRFIHIVVEAKNTWYFDYVSTIYGEY